MSIPLPLYYIALFIHIVSFITGFGSVIVIDSFGLLWLFKRVKISLVIQVANITQRLIWLGWFGLVISGPIMLYNKGFIDNLMWIKLFFVTMLGLNGIFLHFNKKSFERLGDVQEVPKLFQFRIGLASAISQLGWWGALTIGYLHHNWRGVINWPPQPWLIIAAIVVIILISAGLGETFLKNPGPNRDQFNS